MSVEIDADGGEIRTDGTLRRSGGSIVVTVPPEVRDTTGASEGSEYYVVADGDVDAIELRESQPDGEEVPKRCLRRSGGSIVVSIPPTALEAIGAGEGTDVDVAAGFGSSTIELRQNGEE